MYAWLEQEIAQRFSPVQQLKRSPRGTVELLRHKETGQLVICRRFSGSGEVYRQLRALSSPHLAKVLEASEQDGQVIVLEEYIHGDTLEALLREKLFSPHEAAEIGRQICEGLYPLHTMGLVHRDIKPSNVVLRDGHAVLIDFDAARIHRADGGGDTQVLGTVGFAAPEQFGLSESDARSDIYALGVLLNCLVTGAHPSVKLAGGRIGRIVTKCTMTERGRRYRDVLRLRNALQGGAVWT